MAAVFVARAATPVEEAQALMAKGDLNGALQHIDAYLSQSPQDAEARFTRGLILVKQNKSDDAIKAFAALTHDYPQLPEPYNNLAVLYAQRGDYEKARDALEAALKTNPAYATAHENLGDIYAALAGAAYNRALALDKNNAETRYKLSLINQISGVQAGRVPVPPSAVAATTAPAPAAAAATVAPAAAAGSAEASQPPAAAPSGDTAAVVAAVQAWAKAWQSQDVEAYLAAYTEDFHGDDGVDRDAWVAQRRERIGKPTRIKITLEQLQAEMLGPGNARATFKQIYVSNALSSTVTKTLDLTRVNGAWKISGEVSR